MQGTGSDADDSEAETGVQEGVVQVSALEEWHTAILARFAVEDQVDGDESSTEDSCAVFSSRQLTTSTIGGWKAAYR